MIDSDVLVLSIDLAKQSGLENLYVLYGPKEKYYNIFDNFSELGIDVCKGLPFFHAFTGCDTVSSFYKYGKAKHWKVWMEMNKENLQLTELFKRLS